MILEHNKGVISAHYFQCPLKLVISMPETTLETNLKHPKLWGFFIVGIVGDYGENMTHSKDTVYSHTTIRLNLVIQGVMYGKILIKGQNVSDIVSELLIPITSLISPYFCRD